MISSDIIGIIISLLFSAFFSGIEIAFVSTDRLHLELQSKKDTITGKIIGGFIRQPARFIGALLIGNTAALVVYGIFMASALDPLIELYITSSNIMGLLIQTLASTILVLFTAEFLPKSLFLLNANRMLTLFAIPVQILYIILWPFTVIIVEFSKFLIVKVFKWQYSDDKPVFRLTDLNNYVKKITEKAEDRKKELEIDTKIFSNALKFKKIKVRQCMIPRIEIEAVDVDDEVNELKKKFISTGYSKVLIYKETIDNIIGYCHSSMMFRKPKKISDIITPILIVPETKLANELLIEFIEERKSIALVVDEFGGTSGIITIEDVMEEIFGEIRDEHDDDDLAEQRINDRTFWLSARHEIEYLNDKYKLNIPAGDYDTLGGFILSVYEDIPKTNAEIDLEHLLITVKNMAGTRIDKVKVFIKD